MRRIVALTTAALLVLTMSACGASESQKSGSTTSAKTTSGTTVTTTATKKYSITQPSHQGTEKLIDDVVWDESSACAVSYLGTKETYAATLHKLYTEQFSDIDTETLDAVPTVDAKGTQAFLVVPRFELEELSVFKVTIDENGKSHIRAHLASKKEPFILFCDANPETADTMIRISLKTAGRSFKYMPIVDPQTQTIVHTNGFQSVS